MHLCTFSARSCWAFGLPCWKLTLSRNWYGQVCYRFPVTRYRQLATGNQKVCWPTGSVLWTVSVALEFNSLLNSMCWVKRPLALLGSNQWRDNSTDWNGLNVLSKVARLFLLVHSKNVCLKKSICLMLSHSLFKEYHHLCVRQFPSSHRAFPILF